MPNSNEQDFVRFAFQTYARIFPSLVDGVYPHQWALGDFAYPTHSLQKYGPEILAKDLAPDDIMAIEYVSDVYDISRPLLEATLLKMYMIEGLQPVVADAS
ncbi:MAG: hypothetical protein ABJ360_12870 [Roseobacter sp.]